MDFDEDGVVGAELLDDYDIVNALILVLLCGDSVIVDYCLYCCSDDFEISSI